MTPDFKPPWLVQRITIPTNKNNPFAFGGGYKHGGMSDEAWEIISMMCSFDYMGSAEFEFGELPKGINKIFKCGSLTGFIINVSTKHTKNAPVYVIAPEEWKVDITAFLIKEAKGKRGMRLKESTNIVSGIDGFYEWDSAKKPIKDHSRTTGGIDIEHGWMYSFNEEQANNFATLFGVEFN